MQDNQITAIEKGTGTGSVSFKLSHTVTKIKRTVKAIEWNGGNVIREIEVYQVWSNSGIICEIEANSSITLYF